MAADALKLRQGEERTFTVAIADVDDSGARTPVDLTAYISFVTEIWWRGVKRFTLGVGTGIEVLDLSPAPPASGADLPPQYQYRVVELQTGSFPIGMITRVRQVLVNADGETEIGGEAYIKVLPP